MVTDQPRWPSVHKPPMADSGRGTTDVDGHDVGRALITTTTYSSGPTVGPLSARAAVVLPPPPAERTRDERYESLVTTIRAAKQARRDNWREMAHSLLRIKEEHLWEDRGYDSFDRWAWVTLRFTAKTVTKLLGTATEPVGGGLHGQRGWQAGSSGAPRGRARGAQEAEVELFAETGKSSTSPSTRVDGEVTAVAAAAGRGRLGWAARQLGQIERLGGARWRAGFTDAERTAAGREFTRLSDLFARCARAIAAPTTEATDEEMP